MKTGSNTDNKEILIEQYKLYVELTDRLSARRNETSKFYISLLTGLLAVLSLVLQREIAINVQRAVFLAIGFIGITLCFVWNVNIHSYKQLAKLKFNVIHEMEKELPFACFDREWEILGSEHQRYRRLTDVERLVPLLLGVPYLIIIIVTIVTAF